MRVLFALFLLFVISINAISQKTDFRKNAISIEAGFFHRGLIGISYARNFLKYDHTFITGSAFAGLGLYYKHYTGGGIDFNVGKNEVFFCIGADLKGIHLNDWEPVFGDGGPWQFAWEPHLGINVVTANGFAGKFLLGYMFAKEPDEGYLEFPTAGFSLGFAF